MSALGEKAAFVHRVNRGYARWFFSVSLPLEYLDGRVSLTPEEIARRPEEAARVIAAVLDEFFR